MEEARINILVQFVNDGDRRRLWCGNTEEGAGFVPSTQLAQARHVRQGLRADRGRHPERSQSARPDVPNRCMQVVESSLNLSPPQIGEHWAGASIRHMHGVNFGSCFKQPRGMSSLVM